MAKSFGWLQRSDFKDASGKDLVFGAASSAFQFEGAADEDGRGESICDTFAKRKGHIPVGEKGIEGVHHYYRYKEDIKIMKEMGLDAYRFSISWSRVLPNGTRGKEDEGVNKKGIDFYNNLIDELKANGIEPYVTLLHFDPPEALEKEYGGFLNKKIVNDFRDYADLCFSKFGDRVKHWITINEPWGFSFGGYTLGTMAPGRGSTDPAIGKVAMDDHLLPLTQCSCEEAYRPLMALKSQSETGSPRLQRSATSHDDDPLDPMKFRPFTELYCRLQNKEADGDSGKEPYTVSHHQLLAHAKAVDLYKKKYQACQKGKIGITLVSMWMVPFTETAKDKVAAKRALDFMFGKFIEPLVFGRYPMSMQYRVKNRLPSFSKEESKLVKGSFDFIGLNYYTANYVKDAPDQATGTYQTDAGVRYYTDRGGKPIGQKGGSSWLYSYPEGLMELLLYIKEKYDNPIVNITENGFDEENDRSLRVWDALFDSHRVSYHHDHLRYLKEAIRKGANVSSYFIWSLHDNYEWGSGYNSRFGINYIEHHDKKERYPKLSAQWFKYFLLKKSVPQTPLPPSENKKRDTEPQGMSADRENERRDTEFHDFFPLMHFEKI